MARVNSRITPPAPSPRILASTFVLLPRLAGTFTGVVEAALLPGFQAGSLLPQVSRAWVIRAMRSEATSIR